VVKEAGRKAVNDDDETREVKAGSELFMGIVCDKRVLVM